MMAGKHLTVASLIERLQTLPPDMPIIIDYPEDYGSSTGYDTATSVIVQNYFWESFGRTKYPDLQLIDRYTSLPETSRTFKGARLQ